MTDPDRSRKFGTALLGRLTQKPDRGLWEPLRIAAEMFPDLATDDLHATVRSVLIAMLTRGEITLYCRPHSFPDPAERLTLDEALAEVHAGWWREDPLDRGYVWMAAHPREAPG